MKSSSPSPPQRSAFDAQKPGWNRSPKSMHCNWQRLDAAELAKPGAQWQMKPFTTSSQVPPFSQALSGAKLWHSSILTSHCVPSHPAAHAHSYESIVSSAQTPPFRHGTDRHSSTSMEHVSPSHPATQVHANSSMPSTHCPSFSQGSELHSSTFSAHVSPVYPVTHRHTNSPASTVGIPYSLSSSPVAESLQIAPCKQGVLEHSSISSSHVGPSKPEAQLQANASGAVEQTSGTQHISPVAVSQCSQASIPTAEHAS